MKIREETKKPDIKAPRFRTTKWRYNFLCENLYKEFLKENPKYHIEYKDFLLINRQINKEIVDLAIHNKEGVLLPKGLGRLWIGLYPARYVNYYGEVDFSNMVGKIGWDLKYTRYKVKHKIYYGFVAHRTFKRLTAKALKENYGFYSKIKSMITDDQYNKRKKLERREREKLDNQSCNQPSEDTSQGS